MSMPMSSPNFTQLGLRNYEISLGEGPS